MGEPDTNELSKVFEELVPAAFDRNAAAGWDVVIHFDISGSEGLTYTVSGGELKVEKGLQGEATCTITTDPETAIGVFTGRIDGMQAFMSGKMKISNSNVMMKFQQVFKRKKAPSKPEKEKDIPEEASEDENGDLDRLFTDILPGAFDARVGGKWTGNVHLKLSDGQDYTFSCSEGVFIVEKGLNGIPTSIIETSSGIARELFSGHTAGTRAFMTGECVFPILMI